MKVLIDYHDPTAYRHRLCKFLGDDNYIQSVKYLNRPPQVNANHHLSTIKEAVMNVDDLKKILAGFCIASLIAGSSFTLSSCASGKSAGSGDKAGAGGSASG
jgi:radical SAM modification target selenobiotic family peptide